MTVCKQLPDAVVLGGLKSFRTGSKTDGLEWPATARWTVPTRSCPARHMKSLTAKHSYLGLALVWVPEPSLILRRAWWCPICRTVRR